MHRGLTRVSAATILLITLCLSQAGSRFSQSNEGSRGILGETLEWAGLSNLLQNLYDFKSSVLSRAGLDSDILNWLMPYYSGFSRSVLTLGVFTKIIALPTAVVTAICLPLYPQSGILGVVSAIGLLTGFIYIFPLFLVVEYFSKLGIIATYDKLLIIILMILASSSAFCILFAYALNNFLILLSSLILLTATTWFLWFFPILIYYHS
ncbi:MAG: hypothetical protein ACUVQ0_04645 [Thermoproteota archaeon]